MDGLVFEIDKAAINHYKHRLSKLIEKKENIEIKPILEKEMEGLFNLLDEIYKCYDEKNAKQRKMQWDRYVYVTCKALLMYKEDLVRSKKIMSEFGTEKFKLDVRKIEEYLRKVENRLGTLRDTILELKSFPRMSTF